MNASKKKLLYLFCRAVSLLLAQKYSITYNDTLDVDANAEGKVKVGFNICGSHFCLCCLGGGWIGTL